MARAEHGQAIESYVLDDIHNGLVSADGGNVVLDFVDPDGNGAQPMALAKRYLYGEVVDQLFAQEDLSKTLGDAARNLWPLVDHLGTVRDLAKQDGTIAVHYKYDSFGRVTSGDTSKTRYLFTSREFDPATGLQYNRARWYDSRVGRWISEDPLGFVAGDGNIVRYVGNRVTIEADPSGFQAPINIGNVQPSREPLPKLNPGQTVQVQVTPYPAPLQLILGFGSLGKSIALAEYPNLVYADEVGIWPIRPQVPTPVVPVPGDSVMAEPGGRLFGPIVDGQYIGPGGCGPRVGVIIKVPGQGGAVFHLPPGSSPVGSINRWIWPPGSSAAICGGMPDVPFSKKLYDDVVYALRTSGITIDGVTTLPAIYIGNDKDGNPVWHLPRRPSNSLSPPPSEVFGPQLPQRRH